MATDATKDKRTRDRRRKAKNLELATKEVESLNRIDKFIPAGNTIKSKVLSPEDAAQSRVSICVRLCVCVCMYVCEVKCNSPPSSQPKQHHHHHEHRY